MAARATRSSVVSLAAKLSQRAKSSAVIASVEQGKDAKSPNSRKRHHVKLEYETSTKTEVITLLPGGRQDAESKEVGSTSKISRWEPPSWEEQLCNIEEMRRKRDAPVDTMGCDVISDQNASSEVGRNITMLKM